MFNLIYLVLGIYLIKIIVIRVNMSYKKRKNKKIIKKISIRKNITGKIKSIFNEENNIFIFKNNNINHKEKCSLERHNALERARYKCEECGNIANLEVYAKEFNNNEELIVLCKMCYEKNTGKMKLHYLH